MKAEKTIFTIKSTQVLPEAFFYRREGIYQNTLLKDAIRLLFWFLRLISVQIRGDLL